MIIEGLYTSALVKASIIEDEAIEQITTLTNQEIMENANIVIMPDVHAGKGCTIGTTIKLGEPKIIPNLVGVDIGCGMLTVPIVGGFSRDEVDAVANEIIPSGFNVRETVSPYTELVDLERLNCFNELKNIDRLNKSLGTLGGGNHFIEIGRSDINDNPYLIIHTGSRNLGHQVATYYQKRAIETTGHLVEDNSLAYLNVTDSIHYMHDMMIVQEWASYNRLVIAQEFVDNEVLMLDYPNSFETIHNYISEDGIIRKGAVSAHLNKRLLIPLNMADGSLICRGKGNEEWNFSAPHGAGRIMSRKKARRTLKMEDFKGSMEGIYSSSVCEETIDEAPMAYKPAEAILDIIGETVEVEEVIRPIYNFKAH